MTVSTAPPITAPTWPLGYAPHHERCCVPFPATPASSAMTVGHALVKEDVWDPLLSGVDSLDGLTSEITVLVESDLAGTIAFEVRRFFGAAQADQWIDDVRSEVWLKLWARVRSALRGNDPPIAALNAYVRRATQTVCVDHLRQRAPRRTRVEYRLRYLERDDASWRRRRLENGDWVAEAVPAARRRTSDVRAAQRMLDEVHRFLEEAPDGRCAWTDLVNAVADALGEVDERPIQPGDAATTAGPSPGPAADAEVDSMARRQLLEAVWREVIELPEKQRRALLLNLRVGPAEDAVELFLGCGLTSAAELAQQLGIDESALPDLLERLPLSDDQIALQLGLRRRQVVNARLSARRRLARRLREMMP